MLNSTFRPKIIKTLATAGLFLNCGRGSSKNEPPCGKYWYYCPSPLTFMWACNVSPLHSFMYVYILTYILVHSTTYRRLKRAHVCLVLANRPHFASCRIYDDYIHALARLAMPGAPMVPKYFWSCIWIWWDHMSKAFKKGALTVTQGRLIISAFLTGKGTDY